MFFLLFFLHYWRSNIKIFLLILLNVCVRDPSLHESWSFFKKTSHKNISFFVTCPKHRRPNLMHFFAVNKMLRDSRNIAYLLLVCLRALHRVLKKHCKVANGGRGKRFCKFFTQNLVKGQRSSSSLAFDSHYPLQAQKVLWYFSSLSLSFLRKTTF